MFNLHVTIFIMYKIIIKKSVLFKHTIKIRSNLPFTLEYTVTSINYRSSDSIMYLINAKNKG